MHLIVALFNHVDESAPLSHTRLCYYNREGAIHEQNHILVRAIYNVMGIQLGEIIRGDVAIEANTIGIVVHILPNNE